VSRKHEDEPFLSSPSPALLDGKTLHRLMVRKLSVSRESREEISSDWRVACPEDGEVRIQKETSVVATYWGVDEIQSVRSGWARRHLCTCSSALAAICSPEEPEPAARDPAGGGIHSAGG
jgi:hypothetical protein